MMMIMIKSKPCLPVVYVNKEATNRLYNLVCDISFV